MNQLIDPGVEVRTIDPVINPADVPEALAADGGPVERLPLRYRVGSFLAIVVPFLGLIAAVALLWGTGFGWVHLGLLVGGYTLTGLGITVGYHRLFTHRSFETNRVVTAVLGILGSMAVEGSVVNWVANHRRHHQHSDREGDPHSPNLRAPGFFAWARGFYHAHIGWFFQPVPKDNSKYVPDLEADPLVRWISKLFPLWIALGILVPGAIALAITGSWMAALLGVLWGGLARVFLVHHVTWSINSACHLWGARPFKSHDHSRNNLVFGILAMGEGWHNNHHAFPTSARHGLRWWQFDLSYLVILALSGLGLARNVRVPSAERVAAKLAE